GLDRILRYRRPGGGAAENGLAAQAIAITNHLGMVFHRFLDGSLRGRRLRIFVNGDRVEPWDPFARAEEATRSLAVQSLPLATPAGRRHVRVAPHILPREDRFSDRTAHVRAGGPRR